MSERPSARTGSEVAIIGAAGRFPGAPHLDRFWDNLCNGVESVSFFTDEELIAEGLSPSLIQQPAYVKACAYLEDADLFDAAFFGYSPREAESIDPQQRVFLECAWTALEDAGYDAAAARELIGVFAGQSSSTYIFNLLLNPALARSQGGFQIRLANEKDFLTTRVSYKLNLRGPSFDIQTACSTSLVAVHVACQSLLGGECDIALAGGVSIAVPVKSGYVYHAEGIGSPDGHCRPFDAAAQGTVSGMGAGVVVLRRLEDALESRDAIRAVIKGSALNNDGAHKVGFTAPAIDGQAQVIRMAHAVAGIDAATIGFVEAHGTATALGDSIEMAALTRVFVPAGMRKGSCAIGSVKSNIGHADSAAGVTGLIKAMLALQRRRIPPTLHFVRPNPHLALEDGPFYVNDRLLEWDGDGPRRAGVSSFGLGGTNAHVVLEEAPPPPPADPARDWHLLVWSARTPAALDVATTNLLEHLRAHPEIDVADAAYTLQVGRKSFPCRRAIVCRDAPGAIAALDGAQPERVMTAPRPASTRRIALLLPGLGSQAMTVAGELYASEPVVRREVDRCLRWLDIRIPGAREAILAPASRGSSPAKESRAEPEIWMLSTFVSTYALARLWRSWGIAPDAMLGHSFGEYTAACLAGVMTVEEALDVLYERGRLLRRCGHGALLAVTLPEADLVPLLTPDLSIAALNAPTSCTVVGPLPAVARLELTLRMRHVESRRMHFDIVSHSSLVDPVLDDLRAVVARVKLQPPEMPYISVVTGGWIRADQATDPDYWVRHLRQPVRFSDGVRTLLSQGSTVFLDAGGQGHGLAGLVRQHLDRESTHAVVSSLPRVSQGQPAVDSIVEAAGRLWLEGVPIDWAAFNAGRQRRRIPLPSYPFERRRYWLAPKIKPAAARATAWLPFEDWFSMQSWRRALPAAPQAPRGAEVWLACVDDDALSPLLIDRLREAGQTVITVKPGRGYRALNGNAFEIAPAEPDHYDALLTSLKVRGMAPSVLLHGWTLSASSGQAPDEPSRVLETGYYSLSFLLGAYGRCGLMPPRCLVVSDDVHDVTGSEDVQPEKAAIVGPCLCAPREMPGAVVRHVDVSIPREAAALRRLADQVWTELIAATDEPFVAWRGDHRWVPVFEAVRLPDRAATLREDGVYAITGGLGGVGLALAGTLAAPGRRLALIGRRGLDGAGDADVARANAVAALRDRGAEVVVITADVTWRSEVERLLEEVRARWGRIDGVIHCAGEAGAQLLELTGYETAGRALAPKLAAARHLDACLGDGPLDFLVFCSSLNAFLGTPGHSAYCAANACLDTMARLRARRGAARTLSINWDRWRQTGMSVAVEAEHRRVTGEELVDGFDAATGVAAFVRILESCRVPQLAVSTTDITARVAHSRITVTRPGPAVPIRQADAVWHPRPQLTTTFAAPRTGTETELAAVWRDLLGVDPIGVFDSFMELGGQSLLATRLMARVRDRFQTVISLKTFFEAPTIQRLGGAIDAAREGTQDDLDTTIQPLGTNDERAPSFAQQRLWFLDQYTPGNGAFNVVAVLRLRGRLDHPALDRSFQRVIARHESLRTGFATVDGQPAIVLAEPPASVVRVVDLSDLSKADRARVSRDVVTSEAARPFRLDEPPLIQVLLLNDAAGEFVLLLKLHHIVADGWSIGVLVRELVTCYEAFLAGAEPILPELSIQYSDYAGWQRRWLSGARMEASLAYWQAHLAGAPAALELPTDRARPAVQTYRGAHKPVSVPLPVVERLRELARREDATPFMVLLAAFAVVLSRYAGQDHVVIGTGVANRPRPELEPMIGLFVNTIALHTDLSGRPSFRQLLARVRAAVLGGFAHQDVPFEMLVDRLQPVRDPAYHPLYQVMFMLQNTPVIDLRVSGLKLQPFDAGEPLTSKLDLTLTIVEETPGLRGVLEYNTDLFLPTTIDGLLDRYRLTLERVAADPDCDLATLTAVSTPDRDVLIQAFNG